MCRYCSEIFQWNTIQSKKGLAGNLAISLAVLSGQGARQILAVMNLRNMWFEKDVVAIGTADSLKTSFQKFHLGEIKLSGYLDKMIFPMEVLKCFIDLTIDIS